ncbi:MAG: isoprenylcysteine carboxylmethyltransferase family protein [Dehalococcoidia bacterium]
MVANSGSAGKMTAKRGLPSLLQDGSLVLVTTFFVYVHFTRAVFDHQLTAAPFAVEQTVLVLLYLVRRPSKATSTRFWDWVVASATWLPLATQLNDSSPAAAQALGTSLQMLGLAMATLCFLALGRSYGIVAANRGLKRAGPYALVRHPIYLSHTVILTGVVTANFSLVNVAILVVGTSLQLLRIRAEERLLRETAGYADYAAQVRWRLVPGLY